MSEASYKVHAAAVLQKAWIRHQIRTKLKRKEFNAAEQLVIAWFQKPFRHSDDGFKVRLLPRAPPDGRLC